MTPIELELKFGAKNYDPLPVVLTKGQGVHVWDDKGNQYIDMMSAYSAVSHGHCHPELVAAMHEQASKLCIVSRSFYSEALGSFLQYMCDLTGFDRAIPMNTGVEGVETALKAARKWAYQVKKVPADKAEIIACEKNFHGRTLGVIGLSTVKQYKNGFGPFLPGLKTIPFNDAQALEKAITPNTAAFLVEPIQGEGGIIVPDDGYLQTCAEICKRNNVLLICDEIQTGLGRTGKLFAHQYDECKPDGLILGKALGGGIYPVSLFLTRQDVMEVFTPGDHGSTFGGNPLAAVIAHKAVELLFSENLLENALQQGEYFRRELSAIDSSIITEIRGKGLLIGMQLADQYEGHEICLELLQHGLLTKETHRSIIRFAPPLMITKDQIDFAVNAIKKVFARIEQTTRKTISL